MSKKIFTAVCVAAFGVACSKSPVPVQNTDAGGAPKDPLSVSSHGNPPSAPSAPAASNTGSKTKWARGGDPIDTSSFDAAIAKGEKDLKANPNSADKKVALANAYAARGTALTQARQYAAALGDFRRALKHDPSNKDAKGMMDEIISIYEGMDREYPKEGEEPEPKRK